MTDYTVILARINGEDETYSVFVEAEDRLNAIYKAISAVWGDHFQDVYDDALSLQEDGVDLIGVFFGHHDNIL